MKDKFGILKRGILILSNLQQIHLIGNKGFPILMLTRWSLFLIKLLSIYYVILFFMRRFYVMTEIHPPWMNKQIKKLIHEKTNIFYCFRRNNNNKQLLDRLKDLQTQLNFFIEKSEGKYYSRITSKLPDIGKSSKTYWSILKTFLIGKKVPCIPPLFENSEYITDFKKKAELFNSFFANQSSLINNNSQLPPTLSYKTNERLSTIKIIDDGILKIIAKLDPDKVHGHDKISIRMTKVCSTSICKPLRLIFNHCIDNGICLCEWKKANVVPIHKKGDKET